MVVLLIVGPNDLVSTRSDDDWTPPFSISTAFPVSCISAPMILKILMAFVCEHIPSTLAFVKHHSNEEHEMKQIHVDADRIEEMHLDAEAL